MPTIQLAKISSLPAAGNLFTQDWGALRIEEILCLRTGRPHGSNMRSHRCCQHLHIHSTWPMTSKTRPKYSTLHVGKDSQLAYSIRLDFERTSRLTLLPLRGENSPSWNPNASLMTSSGPISVHCTCLHHQPSKLLATSLHIQPSLVQPPKPSRIIAYLWVPS